MYLSDLFRHPIKAIGVETLARVELTRGARLEGDRVWAVAHEAARLNPEAEWSRCLNFVRGASSGQLMSITAKTSESGLTLCHPQRPDLTIDPEIKSDQKRLLSWLLPLIDHRRAAPEKVVRAPEGMTDNAAPWLSLLNHASRKSLADRAGKPLSPLRFRGNLWIEGAQAWEEFEWIGRRLRIGDAEVEVRGRIDRCTATHVDPQTGEADCDLLTTLEDGWGHSDFGVFVEVVDGGVVRTGDTVCLV